MSKRLTVAEFTERCKEMLDDPERSTVAVNVTAEMEPAFRARRLE